MVFFLRGLIIGLAIAAPVGPIGVLCIRRTLSDGRLAGFITGMGAATADMCYGAVAGLGLTVITRVLIDQQVWLRLVGGVFLCYLGMRTILAPPAMRTSALRSSGGLSMYLSTLALTLTNPLTIFSFLGIFAGLGIADAARAAPVTVIALVAGVFGGSALWWFLLSGGVSLLRRQVTPGSMRWINRASGSLILGFGIVALFSLL